MSGADLVTGHKPVSEEQLPNFKKKKVPFEVAVDTDPIDWRPKQFDIGKWQYE